MSNGTNVSESAAARYGVDESNPITDELHAFRDTIEGEVVLGDPNLAEIVRLRLLGDISGPMRNTLDVSYCWGRLKDGTPVRVQLPVNQFPLGGLKGALVGMCRAAGVFGVGLRLFESEVISILR